MKKNTVLNIAMAATLGLSAASTIAAPSQGSLGLDSSGTTDITLEL
ncbi:MAG: hypothetical protein HRU20_26785, partial [Pseudomonadales bacterium]|nr:hypothetical protein [Pseudomonadales bacterium]